MLRTMNLRRIAWDSVRLFFAPLTGAWRGVRLEYARLARASARARRIEAAQTSRR